MSIYGTVKVGDRGQVVIPSKARKNFHIKPEDLLLVLAGRNRRGITMVKTDAGREFTSRVLRGPEQTAERARTKKSRGSSILGVGQPSKLW